MTPVEAHKELADMVPDALRALRACLRPGGGGRHALTNLAAAKEVLNRAGLPAVAATTISNPAGGPVEVTLKLVKAKKDESGPTD